jgi:hypothetical protein
MRILQSVNKHKNWLNDYIFSGYALNLTKTQNQIDLNICNNLLSGDIFWISKGEKLLAVKCEKTVPKCNKNHE